MKQKLSSTLCLLLLALSLVCVLSNLFPIVEGNPDTLTLLPDAAGTYQQMCAFPKLATDHSATINTSTSVFGGASGKFVAASTQYVTFADSDDWYLTADFTIDFWVNFISLPAPSAAMRFFCQYNDSNNRWHMDILNTAGTYSFRFFKNATTIIQKNSSPNIAAGNWYHIAVVRSANSWYVFQNGTQLGTAVTWTESFVNLAGLFYIGQSGGGASYVDGYMDEFRLSNGIARWTGNFSLPMSEYATDSFTKLLLHMNGANGSTIFEDSEFTHVSLVNDSGDTTGVQVTADVASKETENLADTALAGTINSVTVYGRVKGAATTNQIVLIYRTHSVDYETPVLNLTTAFALYSNVTTVNPNTGAAWTWLEVNALEVGARASNLATGTVQFSEFYIVVDYTVAGGWSNTLDGVSSSQIGSVDGVPLSEIGSIDGVP